MPILASEALTKNSSKVCKTETLSSLYNYVLLIPTKSPRSKNVVVYQQKIKDPLRSACQIGLERRVLDLKSEINQRPGFSLHWG